MDCICTEVDHTDFDDVAAKELNVPVPMAEIVNESYCVSIDLDVDESFQDITLNVAEILADLDRKIGIYHLWIKQDYCADHFRHRVLCAYVGKGYVQKRVKSYSKKKWVNNEKLYLTFYECRNRIAKYLEQLFLDVYKCHLNHAENKGTKVLQKIWDEARLLHGTELHKHADLLAAKNPEYFNP